MWLGSQRHRRCTRAGDVLWRRRVHALVSSTYIYNVSRRSKAGCGGGSKGRPCQPPINFLEIALGTTLGDFALEEPR